MLASLVTRSYAFEFTDIIVIGLKNLPRMAKLQWQVEPKRSDLTANRINTVLL
jgi:hypothetical protein